MYLFTYLHVYLLILLFGAQDILAVAPLVLNAVNSLTLNQTFFIKSLTFPVGEMLRRKSLA